jgi:hypothetical protein
LDVTVPQCRTMRISSRLVAAVCLSLTALCARADGGVVVYQAPGCPHFFVETPNGFSWLEWQEGENVPVPGDQIEGELLRYGARSVLNYTALLTLNVQVHGYWLTANQAINQYQDSCGRSRVLQ